MAHQETPLSMVRCTALEGGREQTGPGAFALQQPKTSSGPQGELDISVSETNAQLGITSSGGHLAHDPLYTVSPRHLNSDHTRAATLGAAWARDAFVP